MRVGRLVRIVPDRHFGFIQADEFRDDVFFHFSAVNPQERPAEWEPGQEIEFELNELLRINEQRLQANVVQRATKPLVHTMDSVTDRVSKAKHHPRALRRKPRWKSNRGTRSDTPTEAPADTPTDASENNT